MQGESIETTAVSALTSTQMETSLSVFAAFPVSVTSTREKQLQKAVTLFRL